MKLLNLFPKVIIALLLVAAGYQQSKAQLNGTYTIGGASPNYTTLSAAISALNSLGVNGPVTFLIRDGSYSGTTWIGSINNIAGASPSNRITFRSQSGNKANVTITDGSSGNYIFRFNNAQYITVRDITLVKSSTSYGRVFDFIGSAGNDSILNCTIQGPASTSSSNTMALINYNSGHTGSNIVFYSNQLTNGGMWAYLYGSSTTSTTNDTRFINNTFSMTNSGYYGIYAYYTGGLKFLNNTFNRTGSGVFYGTYIYYSNNDFEFSNNNVNFSTTASTLYAFLANYVNYYSNSSTMTPKMHNNTFTTSNTTGTSYNFYTAYWYYGDFKNNTVNHTQQTGTSYLYGPLYMNNNSKAENNTFNMTATSSGSLYNMSTYMGGGVYADTFVNNKINFVSNSGTIYNYMGYYGSTIITDNEFNVSNVGGTTYNRIDYGQGIYFARNKIKATTTTGTLYGLYLYNTTSYSGATIINNDFDISSTSGTVYGVQAYYLNGDKFYSNVVTTKTAGTNYTLQIYYNYNSYFKNNTFHSNATGSTNYVAYIYNTSSSYKSELKNNIFSRSGTSGYAIYSYDKAYFTADYNLYYTPGGTLFYNITPSYTGNSLQGWRNATGNDMNSLIYQPPFMNAANRDLRIDASSPAAWAVNGRAQHDTVIKQDMMGNNRPIVVSTGVPDLGAYEVSPTSTPPNAVATPANPVANSTQVFTFGEDTVATIDWGADVPSTYTMRQYTGIQAAPMPVGVGRMFFYVAGTPSTWVHGHQPNIRYKDPWVGDIPGGESDAVIARSSNSGAWEGYNYINASTDVNRNILKPTKALDSVGSYTGVQNGRIGIRCVESPKGIAITNITAFAADINWQPVFNPIGYQVIIKTNTKYPTPAEWAAGNHPSTNSLAASGLSEDKTYYVFIRSICGAKDTSGFTMDSFTTLITCHTPVITISGLNGTRAVISWQNVKTAHKYEFAMNKSATPPAVGTDVNKSSILAPFLDEGTEYFVHVRAHCSSIYNQSAWATASFKTWALNVNNVGGDDVQLAVYPNPVQQEMVVTVGGAVHEGTVAIMDMTGKLLKTQSVNSNTVKISVNELPAGMYIVQYTDDNRREQVKFTKQ